LHHIARYRSLSTSNNCTIIATIHQPSTEVFELFDRVLVMSKGGFVAYSGTVGSQGQDIVQHFEHIKGVDPKQPDANPAGYVMDTLASRTNSAVRYGL
jgi:ABC-type multidrug transport system ATPase subunit